jgi:hypothetical protein
MIFMTKLSAECIQTPISVAELCKARICGRSPAGIAGSNPRGDIEVSVVTVVCYQVQIAATGRSLVQRSHTDCVVSLCVNQKPQGAGGHGALWAVEPQRKKYFIFKQCTYFLTHSMEQSPS